MVARALGLCAGLVIAVAAGWALQSSHGSSTPSSIRIGSAWLDATPAGATTAALYATIRASGGSDELLGVTVPRKVALATMLHHTTDSGGVVGMQVIPELPLPAGKQVSLAPGGDHVMLMGLAHRLRPGARVRVVFRFRHFGSRTVTVRVRALS